MAAALEARPNNSALKLTSPRELLSVDQVDTPPQRTRRSSVTSGRLVSAWKKLHLDEFPPGCSLPEQSRTSSAIALLAHLSHCLACTTPPLLCLHTSAIALLARLHHCFACTPPPLLCLHASAIALLAHLRHCFVCTPPPLLCLHAFAIALLYTGTSRQTRCEVLTPRDVGPTWCPVVRHVDGKLLILVPEGARETLSLIDLLRWMLRSSPQRTLSTVKRAGSVLSDAIGTATDSTTQPSSLPWPLPKPTHIGRASSGCASLQPVPSTLPALAEQAEAVFPTEASQVDNRLWDGASAAGWCVLPRTDKRKGWLYLTPWGEELNSRQVSHPPQLHPTSSHLLPFPSQTMQHNHRSYS